MNQFTFIVIIFAVILVFWTYLKNLGTSGSIKISPADVKKKLDTEKGIVLLDVRTRNEYLEKHIPKSTLIPLDSLENEVSKKLRDKNTEIIVYCRSGSRSSMAVKILSKLGYTNVKNLGGIVSWPYETVSGNK